MENTLISAKNLVKYYGEGNARVYALDNVSIEIYSGEFIAILGSSGSGKSTLLNMLGGIDNVDSGEIFYNGVDITKLSDSKLTNFRRDNVAFVFQSFNLLNDISVLDNIILSPGANRNKSDIAKILKKIGIYSKRRKFPKQLSGGEQQRVSIARAVNKRSVILLCDEPTGALDYQSGKDVLSILEKINQEEKKTIILVTHTKEIAKMADRIITMKNGKITSNNKNETKLSVSDIDW